MPIKNQPDTIAAIATPPGYGGVGVLRISGTHLADLAGYLTQRPAPPKARYATLVNFLDAAGRRIDQGLLLYFPAPHSYTGEDVLELQGHGGPVLMQMLLARCLELGCRLATPGEFTRRAYLNGKLDLAQAEAVADVIAAASEQAARCALRALQGEFSREITAIVEALIDCRVFIEARLDFPEEDTTANALGQQHIAAQLTALTQRLQTILHRAGQGKLYVDGLQVVLTGAPNVGKSSLLNALAGRERAIVSEYPGTTRDVLREALHIEGVPVQIIDTAGLRTTTDPVEQMGIARTHQQIEEADVVLHIIEAVAATQDAPLVNQKVNQNTEAFTLPPGIPQLIIENKCDLIAQPPDLRRDALGRQYVRLSAKTGEGVDLLRQALLEIIGWRQGAEEDAFMAHSRHIEALQEAATALARAQALAARADDATSGEELCAEELRQAQLALARITGAYTADDLLGEIFSRFCMGK